MATRRGLRLDHCVIAVTDWERSNAYYRDVLDAEVVRVGGRCVYRFGDLHLNVHGPGVPGGPNAAIPVPPGGSDLCFVWPGSIAEAAAHLARHHVAIELGPVRRVGAGGPGVSIYVRDPDGTLHELITYVAS